MPSGRQLDQGQDEVALSPKASLHTSAPQGGGQDIRRYRQKMALPVPIPSCSSYLGERLRRLKEVPIPRIWAVNMDQVVGCHVEVVISE